MAAKDFNLNFKLLRFLANCRLLSNLYNWIFFCALFETTSHSSVALQRFRFWIFLFSPLSFLNGWHIHYPSAWIKKKAFRWETVFWIVASGLAEDCCEISTWHVLRCRSSFERKEIQPHLPHLLQRPFFAMDECFCFMLFMDAMSRVNIYSSSDCHLTI